MPPGGDWRVRWTAECLHRKERKMKSESMTDVFREESDSILVAAIRNGESQAFEFLVKRHEARTFALAFLLTRNREDAQDVVQQSFHNAFMHLYTFQRKYLFSTCLPPLC